MAYAPTVKEELSPTATPIFKSSGALLVAVQSNRLTARVGQGAATAGQTPERGAQALKYSWGWPELSVQ